MDFLLICLALVFYGAAIFWIRRGGGTGILRLFFGFSGFLLVLSSGLYIVSDYFTGNGIDESVWYHLRYGLAGAGFGEYRGALVVASASILLALAACCVVFRVIPPAREVRRTPAGRLGYAFLLLALVSHPVVRSELISTLAVRASDVPFSAMYAKPGSGAEPSRTKNLVYIYAESLERTYFDETLFPGLIVGLRRLEQRGLSFTHLDPVFGGGWTIAGMVAGQCGIPLVTPSDGNSMAGMDRFLSGAVCLGDLLKEHGYFLTYMAGADLEFAGKGKFYATHGFDATFGSRELIPTLEDEAYVNDWGLFDDSLFERVYRRFEELSESGEKFGLVTLSVDTHHPVGHPSGRCGGLDYGDGSNPMLNAVRCSDFLITELVDRILASPYAQDTLIVIGSDHLAMNNSAMDKLSQGDRKNLFIVIDPDRPQPVSIAKPGSLLDIAPTILSLLGYDTPALGLGRNLLGNEPTLVEKALDPDETLKGWAEEIETFWEYPEISSGCLVDALRGHLRLEDRVLKLPVLLILTEEGGIKEVLFDFSGERKLAHRVLERSPEEPVLWVDAGEEVDAFQPGCGKTTYCVFLGKPGDPNALVAGVEDELYIGREQLAEVLSHAVSSALADERRKHLIRRLKIYQHKRLVFLPGKDALGRIRIRSQGHYDKGDSYLRAGNTRQVLARGVSLVGIAGPSTVAILSNVDACSDQNQPVTAEPFRAVVERSREDYHAFAIVVHDSMQCEPAEFSGLFAGLGLEKVGGLKVRQPYIAFVSADLSRKYEIAGGTDGSIALLLNGFYRKE
ncbi:MAG: sulfatase-like hydrolase/transferase [Thermodesulfobacteriota bacterium]